jgi:hypothetical protein
MMKFSTLMFLLSALIIGSLFFFAPASEENRISENPLFVPPVNPLAVPSVFVVVLDTNSSTDQVGNETQTDLRGR